MKYFAILCLVFSIVGCEPPASDVGPDPFSIFIYTKEGANYLDLTRGEDLEFYIIKNGGVKVNSFATRVQFRDSTILNTSDTFNVKPIPKDYYLKIGDDIDTLFIERKDGKFKTVLFNGEKVEWRYNPGIHFFATKKR